MRKPTRRTILRTSGIAAAALIAPGVSSATGDSDGEKKLRLRREMSDPLSLAHIHEQKKDVIENSSLYENNEVVPDMRVEGPSENDKILAYNFDIIDGVPSEWTGMYRIGAKKKDSEGGKDDKERKKEAKKTIHNKAEDNAQKRKKRKERNGGDGGNSGDGDNGKDGSIAGREQSASSGRSSSLSSTTTVDDWSSWEKKAESDSYITDDGGNDMSWESKWKEDTEDDSNQGLNTEITMRPETDNGWLNAGTVANFDYNDSSYDEIGDYGPGNTIGTNTQTFSLAVSSDLTVEVGVSSSTTSSDLDIDNKSDTDADYVKHKYTINGDLEENTVRVNQSATTNGTDDSYTGTYCNQDLDATFYSIFGVNTIEKDIRVYWY